MNLDSLYTTTTVEFDKKYQDDDVEILETKMTDQEKERIIQQLDRIRKIANSQLRAKVKTINNFPKSAGIASSASGMAALTMAAACSLGLKLSEKELSILARQGSGSASRSVPSGFVVWHKADDSKDSFAETLKPKEFWDLRDVVLIVEADKKKVTSTEGHAMADTSPFYRSRIIEAEKNYQEAIDFFLQKDFMRLAKVIERDCVSMHAVMMTQNPPLFYWLPKTLELIQSIRALRENEKWPVAFTVDAGPNVHVICEGKIEKTLKKHFLSRFVGINKIVSAKVGVGVRLSTNHLWQ